MTEKRFKNVGKDIFQYGGWYCSAGGEHCADVIATALNELTEENKQLKEQNQRLSEQKHIYKQDWKHLCIDKELLDSENEQLNERIKELEKENKELKDKNSQLQETLAFRSNQLALMERLVDDLGSEEMARQMEEILND